MDRGGLQTYTQVMKKGTGRQRAGMMVSMYGESRKRMRAKEKRKRKRKGRMVKLDVRKVTLQYSSWSRWACSSRSSSSGGAKPSWNVEWEKKKKKKSHSAFNLKTVPITNMYTEEHSFVLRCFHWAFAEHKACSRHSRAYRKRELYLSQDSKQR